MGMRHNVEILMNTWLVRDSFKCDDMIVRELVDTVTENDGFSICLLKMRPYVTAWRDK